MPIRTRSMEHYSIRNHSAALRPLNKSDYPQLHHWHTNLNSLHVWQVSRDILNYIDFEIDFERRLRRNIDTFFIICNPSSNQAIGFTYNYSTNYRDKITYCCIYLAPEHTRSGFGLAAAELLGNYLFQNCGFRKIYAEVFDYNHKVFQLAKWFGFQEEGCLKEFRWYNDKYWDVHLLALTQAQYTKNKKKLT